MTELGLGVPRDVEKAIDIYKKAAEQNTEYRRCRGPARRDLSEWRSGAPPEFSQATSYRERAAYHADPRSAMLLDQMYRVGLGTPVDQKQAYAWSEVALPEGSEFAKRERDSSLRDLSVSDQQTAVPQAQAILKEIKRQTMVPTVP